jgi:hypothetical protein
MDRSHSISALRTVVCFWGSIRFPTALAVWAESLIVIMCNSVDVNFGVACELVIALTGFFLRFYGEEWCDRCPFVIIEHRHRLLAAPAVAEDWHGVSLVIVQSIDRLISISGTAELRLPANKVRSLIRSIEQRSQVSTTCDHSHDFDLIL